ncbi:MAG: hypothetical protein GF417_10965 [Candidatus Latescibacteria bacterium]|nr:hypothetical protein [bacterium]MBD3424946.1 hypothetical protein [Candidatus Latescibacterota bacterium]
MKRKSVNILLVAAALAAIVLASRTVEGIGARKREMDIQYLPNTQSLKLMSLGYRNLVSDILWFKTTQYYGGYRMGRNSLRLFKHLINVITDLDPQFTFAYQLGAVIMAEDMGDFEEGRRLLRKGIENNPENWRLNFELGFLYYITGRDYKMAQQYFTMASRMPGANERALRFAASAAARGDDLSLSIKMWKHLADNTEEEFMKELAAGYIRKLEKKMEERREEGE